MKMNEMRDEYDFSLAKRGVLKGKVEKKIAVASGAAKLDTKALAVCVKTFDAKSLIARKIYNVEFLTDGLVKVVDEAGEAEVYPAEFFLPLALPTEITKVLENIAV